MVDLWLVQLSICIPMESRDASGILNCHFTSCDTIGMQGQPCPTSSDFYMTNISTYNPKNITSWHVFL